jgi:transposase-like protein
LLTGKRNFIISQSKYLNNIVEQDHRHIKRIVTPMGGFRTMRTAARTIAGIELMNMIKKKQLNFTKHIDQNLTPAQQFYRLASV